MHRYREQSSLANELGIGYKDWQRITTLLSKPPPKLIGGHLVMNSVLLEQAIVIDTVVERSMSEPLRESVCFAKARSDEREAARGKPKDKGLCQDTWGGKDVTELIPLLEQQIDESAARVEARKALATANATSAQIRREEKVKQACCNLLSGRAKGDATQLAIADLLTLIAWKGGTLPADKTAANRDEIVKVWEELQIDMDIIRSEAAKPKTSTEGGPASKKRQLTHGSKAGQHQRAKGEDDSSEDEDSSEEVDEQDQESEDEEDDEQEPTWNVERIVGERGKGKTLQYEVEWEGEEWKGKYTWEPAAFMLNTIALKEYLEAKKQQQNHS